MCLLTLHVSKRHVYVCGHIDWPLHDFSLEAPVYSTEQIFVFTIVCLVLRSRSAYSMIATVENEVYERSSC